MPQTNLPQAVSAAITPTTSLHHVVLDHGPTALLGRVILKAVACAEERGVVLELTTLDQLYDFNREFMKDWPLMPIFQPDLWPRDGSAPAFAILGRDTAGRVVATQAARFFDWSTTSLATEIETLRLFYGLGQAPLDAKARVSWPGAQFMTGRVVYSGSTWFDAAFRGRELSAILPRLSRALALGLWNTDTTISFMDWRIVEKGVAESYGYSNLEKGICLQHIVGDNFDAAIGWISRSELELDAEVFLHDFVVDWRDGAQSRGRQGNRPMTA